MGDKTSRAGGADKQPANNKAAAAGKKQFGKPFEKGKSGNPKGRPRRSEAFGKTIREWLDRRDPKDKAGRTRIMALIQRLYDDDPKTLLAYGFGKPVEMVEVAAAEGQAVEFVVALRASELP